MLLGLAEVVSRAVWYASEGGVRFVAAMISVGIGVAVLWRFGRRLIDRHTPR